MFSQNLLEEEYSKKLNIVKYETSYSTECEHVNTTLRTDTQVSLCMVMEDTSEGEGRGMEGYILTIVLD